MAIDVLGFGMDVGTVGLLLGFCILSLMFWWTYLKACTCPVAIIVPPDHHPIYPSSYSPLPDSLVMYVPQPRPSAMSDLPFSMSHNPTSLTIALRTSGPMRTGTRKVAPTMAAMRTMWTTLMLATLALHIQRCRRHLRGLPTGEIRG